MPTCVGILVRAICVTQNRCQMTNLRAPPDSCRFLVPPVGKLTIIDVNKCCVVQQSPVKNIPEPKRLDTAISQRLKKLFPAQLKSSNISNPTSGGSKIQGRGYSNQGDFWTMQHLLTSTTANFPTGGTRNRQGSGGALKLVIWHRYCVTQIALTRIPTQVGITNFWGEVDHK